jgi:UDP-3-O-[3-hydroxymyristoyl] N-acetylglucosamine deacetylase
VFKHLGHVDGKNLIPAHYNNVVDTRMCTLIANQFGARVGTIEHVMAALRGCGVDNALIEVDADEVPVMDGSSKPFVDAIQKAGLVEQDAPRCAIKILKTITVQDGDKSVTLSPSDVPVYSGRIEFKDTPVIGVQEYSLRLVNGNFVHDVADCRTFGFLKDAKALKAMNLGLGGSLDNAVIIGDEGEVMNAKGLRCSDEFIRHKILDAVGDLYLAGGPILGHYRGHKAGHALNNAVLHALFADASAWVAVDLMADIDESETVVFQPSSRQPRLSVN